LAWKTGARPLGILVTKAAPELVVSIATAGDLLLATVVERPSGVQLVLYRLL